jgi:selenoprotein W-related protein
MKPILQIDYCPKCGWLLRASWTCQELLTTFAEELGGITLAPSETNGTFTLSWNGTILFDRKSHGGFLEMKELKQLVRNHIAPHKSLGHSDHKPKTP